MHINNYTYITFSSIIMSCINMYTYMIIGKAYKIQLNILYTIYNIIEKIFFSVNNLNEHFSSFNPDIKQN